jgi:hypothetical protein
MVQHVYLLSVTAWVLGNLKVAVGFAFTGACVGEFVAATPRAGIPAVVRPEHLQRDVRPDPADPGRGDADLRHCRPLERHLLRWN